MSTHEPKKTDAEHKSEASKKPSKDEHAGHAHASAKKHEAKPHAKESSQGAHEEKSSGKATHKPSAEPTSKEGASKPAKASSKAASAKKPASEKRPAKSAAAEPVKVVDKPTPKYTPNPKPELTPQQRQGLSERREIDNRRPRFRRQQWYEYKRLAKSGWRRPTGVDSAMRRHFGYEQSVVRVGFRGPVSVRGLHASGFEEIRVEQIGDLKSIDPKRQAARISGTLGSRKLKLIYAEADKLGVRVLNRRNLQ